MSLAQHYHIMIISLSLSQPYHININHHQYDNHMSVISVLYRQDHIMTMYVIVMLSGYVTSSSLGIFPYSTIPCCICKIAPCKSLSKHAIKPKSTTVREEQEACSSVNNELKIGLIYQDQISLYFALIPCAAPQPSTIRIL